jgi:hypothetical protein
MAPIGMIVGLCVGCVAGLALWGSLVRNLTNERDELEGALKHAYGTIDRLTRRDGDDGEAP